VGTRQEPSTLLLNVTGLESWAQLSGGHGGRVPSRFQTGDTICYVPSTFFSLGFVFGEVAKIKMTFVTFHVRCIAKPS